jgi:hypothetical protein
MELNTWDYAVERSNQICYRKIKEYSHLLTDVVYEYRNLSIEL